MLYGLSSDGDELTRYHSVQVAEVSVWLSIYYYEPHPASTLTYTIQQIAPESLLDGNAEKIMPHGPTGLNEVWNGTDRGEKKPTRCDLRDPAGSGRKGRKGKERRRTCPIPLLLA